MGCLSFSVSSGLAIYKQQGPISSRKTLIEKLSNREFTFIIIDRNTAATRSLLSEPEFVSAIKNQGFETRQSKNSAAKKISLSSRSYVIAENSIRFEALAKLYENLIAKSDHSRKMHMSFLLKQNSNLTEYFSRAGLRLFELGIIQKILSEYRKPQQSALNFPSTVDILTSSQMMKVVKYLAITYCVYGVALCLERLHYEFRKLLG